MQSNLRRGSKLQNLSSIREFSLLNGQILDSNEVQKKEVESNVAANSKRKHAMDLLDEKAHPRIPRGKNRHGKAICESLLQMYSNNPSSDIVKPFYQTLSTTMPLTSTTKETNLKHGFSSPTVNVKNVRKKASVESSLTFRRYKPQQKPESTVPIQQISKLTLPSNLLNNKSVEQDDNLMLQRESTTDQRISMWISSLPVSYSDEENDEFKAKSMEDANANVIE